MFSLLSFILISMKKQNSPTWCKTYKNDDIVFTMLAAVALDKGYWPDQLFDMSGVEYIQLVSNQHQVRKYYKTKTGIQKKKLLFFR